MLQEQVEELGAGIARLEQPARQSLRAGAGDLEQDLVQYMVFQANFDEIGQHKVQVEQELVQTKVFQANS